MKDDRDFLDRSLPPRADAPRESADVSDAPEELLVLARLLRDMPARKPPRDLTESVLRSVRPKRVPAWRRWYLWMTAPRVITVSPLKLIPVAAVVIALAVFVTTEYLPEREIPFGLEQGQQKLVSVKFTFQHPGAHSVSLIGSFNQWNPVGFEMRQKGEEKVWLLELRLPVGRHHYAFLVNDELILTDPNTPFSARDGFGNKNSIIFVSNEYEKTI